MSIAVLIAEDEFLIAIDVIDELSAAGFEPVGPFSTTAQALEYCQAHTPDCAVLDVRLGDDVSLPIADLLTEREVPVIFYSGHASAAALRERYPKGRVCPKPAASNALAALVAEVCEDAGAKPSHASA
jgi:two-component system, response regulator PdtaR